MNSLKGVRLALPRQGTIIDVLRDGQAIGYGQFVKTGFRFRPAGLMGAKQLVASPFCRTYQCRAYQSSETTTTVTMTGRPGVKPAFLIEVTFHGTRPSMYDIAMYRKEFSNVDVQRILLDFLTQANSVTTLPEIQAACRKPDNNPQAQYLACRDAAHSDKDLTIRVVR